MNTPSQNHIGRKITRLRELRGMKQEALAFAMGVSQQTISNLENSKEIEDKRLQEIADALGVSKEAIENFSDEAVMNYINNFYDSSSNTGQIVGNNQCTFNPLDKVVELFEENKKLYERLVQAEKEKVAYLEKLLERN